MRPLCLIIPLIAAFLAGCGGPSGAIEQAVHARYPHGELLQCKDTGRVRSGSAVWSCAVRRANADGEFAAELNRVEDRLHPLELCFVVVNGAASVTGC